LLNKNVKTTLQAGSIAGQNSGDPNGYFWQLHKS